MTQWKTPHSWPSIMTPFTLTAAALLCMSAADPAAVGATPRSGTSNRPAPPIQNAMTLKCQVTSLALMTGDSDTIKVKVPTTSSFLALDVVHGELLTAAPERARLRLLSTEMSGASMFFEQLMGTGNVALWSFHALKNGRILFSHQMSADASGPNQEKIVLASP